ncbi:MAG: bifunctional nuclease family protein [Bacteroidota bacterium]|nr:bifunctional nuclease family protein [Bacteroidota bacterium]MDP4233272.1 bifunctional nuclease family protein [Bacteroidota bacterium]MDP4242108.1 bifunctional nuclease family protein [Bacteroidota bacterium]MDP4288613.1 bifunctional nuclease family protein [Bacteroidota bacterium]
MDRVQVEILGISTSPSTSGAYALILRETAGLRRIPIIIGGFEAQAIALEMEGIKPPRPLTHDLLKQMVESLGGSISEASINELRDGTFFASLRLSDEQEIDARPSDAIALAIRFGVPIYVTESVMTEASFLPEEGEEEIEEGEEEEDMGLESQLAAKSEEKPAKTNKPLTLLDQLNQQLNEAIKKEEYERAAKIRDDIQKHLAERKQ